MITFVPKNIKKALAATLIVGLPAFTIAEETEEDTRPPCCRNVEPSQPYTDGSIYQLESKWTSDAGKEIRLGVLHGKPQVVAMFFAQCEYACPIILHDMKRIEKSLPDELRDQVGFLMITFDTERDSVEVLHEYREKHNLSNKNWTLLRGDSEDVRELAALLGINYRKDVRGQFAHSNLITLLSAEGEIVDQVKGLNQPVDDAAKKLMELATISKLKN